MNLDMSARYVQTPNLEINEAPDGYVIYQSDPDRVHFLNTTAAVMLELCNGEHSLQDIADILQSAYELDAAPMEELSASASNLIAEGLIQPCTG
ncbi:PqqD family protein [Oricola sp.]|uniref:PqqD family protein n=1 Tax=Oricola sp. TaxID=1979950 RepID=UPI0025EA4FCD|nr:PqqD family protein [Oricola sp.]MCI5073611.1 PqqD family protein [Oricola sp.]